MKLGICSFSFHRLLASGKQDIFRYIRDCKELGCTQLDPWNAHLSTIRQGDAILDAGRNPSESHKLLGTADEDYIEQVRQAAAAVEMPWGTVAVDGAHIYEPTEEARKANRARAYRWIDVASRLGAKQVRIDAGGPESMPPDVFAVIKDAYRDVIAYAKARNVQVLFENHFGPSVLPDNCLKLLEHIDGLGFLLDTHNWKEGHRDDGRKKLAKYAAATHIKTLSWDADGNETDENVPEAIGLLLAADYQGTWGIESVPRDCDEYAGCRKTIALIKRCIGGSGSDPTGSIGGSGSRPTGSARAEPSRSST